MKRAAIFSFSERGGRTAQRVAELISEEYACTLHVPKGGEKKVVGELFGQVDAMIFVCACGIAVRAVAPYLRDKTTDPAVICLDDRGLHVISLLSGHIGGANALTRFIAAGLGGEPVITTATDVNGRFAADEWAARHGVKIDSMEAAKRFAAEILSRDLPLWTEFDVKGQLPGGVILGEVGDCGLAISCHRMHSFDRTLLLIPRVLHVGIGCRRGTPAEKIEAAVSAAFEAQNLCRDAVKSVASIDVKKDEAGLLAFCEERRLPARFYSKEELRAVEGAFTASAFVQNTVGVDNVCERAAMRSAGSAARLIQKKTCLDGVTVAVAQEEWSVCFE